jgi:hypothetical protein
MCSVAIMMTVYLSVYQVLNRCMFTYLITATQYNWVGNTDYAGLSTYGYYKEVCDQAQILFSTELINFTGESIEVAFDNAYYYNTTNKDVIFKFVSIEPYAAPPLSATYDYATASFTKITEDF